ncbi:MAG: hypothetical protein KAJ28_10370 [Flavobacteriaceae bacterium]|nr:hypothetical protein [Flavobacteriaceae bacterium]
MKKVIIGLFVLGFTSLSYSQVKDEVRQVELETISITNINKSYLDRVQDATMSVHVKLIENRASKCNITTSPKYDGRDKPFIAVFKSSKGSIVATYDNKGKILTTTERFKNIKLPDPVRISVFKNHPNWALLSVTYSVSYHFDKDVRKVYKVKIGNGNLKKNLKIDFSGDIIYLSSIENLNTTSTVSYINQNE